MAFRLIPREEKFYTDFQALADELKHGAQLLEQMVAPEHPIWDKADEIKEVEHKCDFLTHGIIQRLNRTFVTPLDREDIHELARSLDDIMDSIDASATLIRLYRLETVRFGTRELAQIITASTEQVRPALDALEHNKGLLAYAVEINRLENEADRIHQQAVSRLVRRRARSAHRDEVERNPGFPRGRDRPMRRRRQRPRGRHGQTRIT